MIIIKTIKQIEVDDWNRFVTETYGRPYNYQQQDGCKERGIDYITVPVDKRYQDDFENDHCPEVVNRPERGVSFKSWLERDPDKPLDNSKHDYDLRLWYHRNFYPRVDMIINDLHRRGLLDPGDYQINIDW